MGQRQGQSFLKLVSVNLGSSFQTTVQVLIVLSVAWNYLLNGLKWGEMS